MKKIKRIQGWRALSPFCGLKRLVLGGDYFDGHLCPVDLEELRVILGLAEGVEKEEEEGQGCLAQLKELVLEYGTLGEAEMELLASQGCGTNLKTLCL